MAQLINVKLSRFDACPWGFRLQGGKDFGAPLVIQKVNGGSPAEKAGLQAGDAVIKVNDAEVFNLRHKEAQDQIVRAGNNFEITIQRGGSTWKPQVTPVGPSPVIGSHNIQPVTKTSLAAKPQSTPLIGSGHNFAPKPFGGPQVNGDATVKSIVNKQYNTPVGIYSEETIAETLSAQAEVLAGGVLGVNFKKNEKTYNPATSEVLKMVQEIDSEPKIPEPDHPAEVRSRVISTRKPKKQQPSSPPSPVRNAVPPAIEPSSVGTTVSSPPTGLRHVSAPETKPTPTTPNDDPFKVLPPGQNICAECERLIVGVFVRIKDKNLHVECFKCATCGTSLKNVGYYNINNKLYCDIHAKLVARQNPPAPNWDPIAIPPGGKAPTGALPASLAKAASTAAAKTITPTYAPAPAPAPAPARPAPAPAPAPSSPQSNLAPLPFHPVSHSVVYKNGFESENNLKNGISSIPALPNDDTDSIKSHTSILRAVNKAPRGGHHHVNPPRPIQQSPSSLAGPKPFSTPAAPTTSPARPAPAGSKFVWPPRAEEEEPTPTATPLYIPPSPYSPRPSTPKAAAVAVKSSPKPTSPASVSNISHRVAAVASQLPTIPTQPSPKVIPVTSLPPVLPAQPLTSLEPITTSLPMPVTKPSTNVAPFPQPFSEYIAKHRSAMVSVASPIPFQQFEQPKPMQSHKISEKLTQEEGTAINKRLSVCSEEVLSINAEKSVPKFETLTESLTPDGVQRPASPVPMQEVSQASSNLDIASEVESSKQETSEMKAEVDTKVSDIETKKQLSTTEECISEEMICMKDNQQSDETISAIQKSEESVKESIIQEVSVIEQKQEQSVTSQQSIQFSEIQASSQISIEKQEVKSEFVSTQSSTQSASSFVPVSKEQQQSASQFQQHTRQLSFEKNSMLTSTASTSLSASSHLNRDQECASPMVSALTIAPDRPYSPLPSATKPALSSPVVTPKISQAPISSEVQTSAASRSELCSSPMVSALTIAPDRPYSPLPSATKIPVSSGTEAPPSFTQSPTQVPKLQPVHPTQTNPSFTQPPTQPLLPTQPTPASPIYIPTPTKTAPPAVSLGGSIPTEGCPSSMLSALTIAPDRPYSPLPTVTKIPGSLPTHMIPISKPATAVAPPPVPVSSVSREEACPSPMVAALTIAPERPYSPLTPITQASRFEAAHTYQKQLQTSFAPVQPMVPKKTGTQLPVSKILPLTTSPKYSFPPPSITQASSVIPQPKPAPSKSVFQPKTSGPTVQQLPVIGAFRPIVAPSTANTFRPISQEISQPQSGPPERSLPPRPQTPKARIATPTSGGRGGTPKIGTLTGLHKPATIPYYQLEIGEYPGQRPSSATPTCPMTDPQVPQAHTPQSLQQTATPASFPFPNIPLPEGARPGAAPLSQTFRPIPQPSVSKQTSTAPVYKPSPTPVSATQLPTSIAKTPSVPNAGGGGGSIGGGSSGDKRGVAGSTAPRRGKGVLTQPQGGGRIPMCASCSSQIRGPFITALGKTWCPEHFICVNAQCRRPLADIGFVEEKGELYCEYCFEKYLAPTCDKCGKKVKGDCLNAIGKHFHPECFLCAYCGKLFGNNPFFLEDGLPYCEADWNELFTTKCFACGFPIEAGDRWVEALSNNYHSQCFNCTACKKNLEGQSFYAKGGRPYCKAHAR